MGRYICGKQITMHSTAFLCLMYHSFEETPTGSYTLSWGQLLWQLDRLKSEGFRVEGMAGLEARLDGDDWPRRYAVATFDDGHRSFLRAADELNARGFRGTFFLTRNACLQRPNFLKKAEIRQLADLAEVGAHGVTHRPISLLAENEMRCELADSKRWLEDLIGREVRYMSAPGGYWNATAQRVARDVGYALVGNSTQWWNRPERVTRTRQVNRVALRTHFGSEQFERILAGDPRFYLGRRLRSLLLAGPRVVRGLWEVRRRAR